MVRAVPPIEVPWTTWPSRSVRESAGQAVAHTSARIAVPKRIGPLYDERDQDPLRGDAVWRTMEDSGRGAAWLARLLGVQEVPSSNLGGPTKFLKGLQTPVLLDPAVWSPTGVQTLRSPSARLSSLFESDPTRNFVF